jgi:hypothetical protein
MLYIYKSLNTTVSIYHQMPAYFIREGIFGVEGAVFTEDPLTPDQERKMYEVAYLAIADFNHFHYHMRVPNIDKAGLITFYLKKYGIKDAKYQYLG